MSSVSHSRMMEKYELLTQLGDGTFGCVIKAVCKKTGQPVAIKKMKQKFYTWEECVKLPEVEVVRRIHAHPNILKLREVVRENNELFLVLEFMDGDLLGVIRKAKQMQNASAAVNAPLLGYPKIKSYMFQILQSLAYLHRKGYFHRDMKPENLLIKEDSTSPAQEVVKLADFGLAKDIRARPPFTDYVSTRWYRSPELLLQERVYGPPVDIWAAGCILAELITTRPLFAGSNEVDQLQKIMNVLGSPNEQTWPDGMVLARRIRYTFPNVKGVGLERALPPHIPSQVFDLMKQMLTYDPKKRPSAQQCLQHPYFNVGVDGESVAPLNAAKKLATASKKYASCPQSFSQGLSAPVKAPSKRSSLITTNALPKVTEVGNGSPNKPIQRATSLAPPTLVKEDVSITKKLHEYSLVSKVKKASEPTPIPTTTPTLDETPPLAAFDKSGGTSTEKISSSSKTTKAGSAALANKLDLESVINDFSSELKTLGLFTHQKQQSATPPIDTTESRFSGAPQDNKLLVAPEAVEKKSPDKPDLVASLLNSSRYKRSSFAKIVDKAPPLHPIGKHSVKHMDSKPAPSPAVVAHPKVSTSIQALLALHKKGGFGGSFK